MKKNKSNNLHKERKDSSYMDEIYKKIEIDISMNKTLYSNKFNHIYIYEEISNECVRRVKSELDTFSRIHYTKTEFGEICTLPKPIVIHIHSSGGDTNAGIALSNLIQLDDVPVIVIAEGVVASAATFILIKAKLNYIAENAFILIHQFFGTLSGKSEELLYSIDIGKEFMDFLINLYSTHTNLSKEKIKEMLKHDVFMSADETIKNGLIKNKLKEDTKMEFDFYIRGKSFSELSKNIFQPSHYFNTLKLIKTDEEADEDIFSKTLSIVKHIHNLSLYENPTPVLIHLSDSTSGGFFSTILGIISVLNTIATSRVPTVGIVSGPIQSYSTLLFITLNKRYIYKDSYISIDFVTTASDSYKFEDTIKNTKFIRNIIMSYFRKKTKMPKEMIDSLFVNRYIITPQQAITFGLADHII